jgi:hypothetical protein
VELAPEANGVVRVLEARRGSVSGDLPLTTFMSQCEGNFDAGGCIIDEPFQPRLPDGMIRCYMGTNKVVGFGHQFVKALLPPRRTMPPPNPNSETARNAVASAPSDTREDAPSLP